jgi:hypothetical protein
MGSCFMRLWNEEGQADPSTTVVSGWGGRISGNPDLTRNSRCGTGREFDAQRPTGRADQLVCLFIITSSGRVGQPLDRECERLGRVDDRVARRIVIGQTQRLTCMVQITRGHCAERRGDDQKAHQFR